jgi:hypothetical protein
VKIKDRMVSKKDGQLKDAKEENRKEIRNKGKGRKYKL